MTDPRTLAEQLRARVSELARDVGTVMTVAQRRSDPDADHKAMMFRLRQWQLELFSIADSLLTAVEEEPAKPINAIAAAHIRRFKACEVLEGIRERRIAE